LLAGASRLRRRAEFSATIKGGRRAARGAVVVHLTTPAPTAEPAGPARAGFVVPKPVGGAVQRNRVRRRLRHLMRDRLAALPPGTAVVVRALAGAAERDHAQLAADLDGALSTALARAGRTP
jgi:ribonuclease P protein component